MHNSHKRWKGMPISMDLAVALKTLVLGSGSKKFPPGWVGQSFTFSKEVSFAFIQKAGGPCGVLAAVQAHVIKHHFFKSAGTRILEMTKAEQCQALTKALTGMLCSAMDDPRKGIKVLEIGLRTHFHSMVRTFEVDGVTETLNIHEFKTPMEAEDFISSNIESYMAGSSSAVISFLYSILLTRGLERVRQDMDNPEMSLMGAHGYCSQEMVNLLALGRAASNTFDGNLALLAKGGVQRFNEDTFNDSIDSTILKGILERSEVGLLTLYEHYKSCKVGENLKTPRYPIWIISSESHFTVIFSLDPQAVNASHAERNLIKLIYYDQLAKQECPIFINLKTSISNPIKVDMDDALVSPIEHCLRTKWLDANVDWNGTDPLL